jgi:hypothetical protein
LAITSSFAVVVEIRGVHRIRARQLGVDVVGFELDGARRRRCEQLDDRARSDRHSDNGACRPQMCKFHGQIICYDRAVIKANQVMPAVVAEVIRKAPLTDEKVAFAWRWPSGPAWPRPRASGSSADGTLVCRRLNRTHGSIRFAQSVGLIRSRLAHYLGDERRQTDFVRMTMRNAFIVSAFVCHRKVPRHLEGFHRAELGAMVVREVGGARGIDPAIVDECIMGNVVSAASARRRRARRRSRAASRITSPRSPSTRCAVGPQGRDARGPGHPDRATSTLPSPAVWSR